MSSAPSVRIPLIDQNWANKPPLAAPATAISHVVPAAAASQPTQPGMGRPVAVAPPAQWIRRSVSPSAISEDPRAAYPMACE